MTPPFKYLVIDGEIVPYDEARLHIETPAVKYGATAFEGIRGYWSDKDQQLYLFRSPEHMQRLLQSARLMGMQGVEYSIDDLQRIVIDLLRANEVREGVHIRPSLYVVGSGSVHARQPISLGMVVAPGDAIIPKESGTDMRYRLTVSSWRRIDDNSVSPRIKSSANYQNGRMALIQAEEDGYDGALMLDGTGHVTEEPRACVFMVRGGTPITPPVTSDILESVTRDTVIQLFKEQQGIEVQERQIDRTELYIADEIFLCGSGMEVQPVSGIDHYTVGDGSPGPLTTAVGETYAQMVRGENGLHTEWLTPVYS